jgi:G3E family GTPase
MIPLVLMAGFLGAGKTRFLTHLVPALAARGVRVRIILNDFENATIDAARLGALDALVTPLNGECVCCGSLRELLQQLYETPADAGSVMLIEANGATETDELLGHLTTDTQLAHFTLPLQLTVLDAARWQKRWWHNALEREQLRTATHVHLNWTERLGEARLAHVKDAVRAVNAAASYTDAAGLANELSALVADLAVDPSAGGRATLVAAAPSHRHSHTHRFSSASFALPALVDRARFQAAIAALPTSVVRAKGMVRFADTPESVFIWQKVPGRRAVRFERSPYHDDVAPTALCIGVGMDVELLRSLLAI